MEVNRCGTIAKAAKKIYVSHACVSSAVRALEEELGFAIFERSWHGVVPAVQGAKALEHARAICEHQKLLFQSSREIRTIRVETGVAPLFFDVLLRLIEEYRGQTDVTFCHQQGVFQPYARGSISGRTPGGLGNTWSKGKAVS